MFRKNDLPRLRDEWAHIFRATIGSPDPYGRQLNGLGGGISSLSKICVVAPSEREDADVDYTFVQVQSTIPLNKLIKITNNERVGRSQEQ